MAKYVYQCLCKQSKPMSEDCKKRNENNHRLIFCPPIIFSGRKAAPGLNMDRGQWFNNDDKKADIYDGGSVTGVKSLAMSSGAYSYMTSE